MRRRRPDERNGNTRRAAGRLGIALFAGLVAMSTATGLCAQDLTGRAILSDQNFDSDGISSNAFDQLYEVRFQHQVTDPFRYLLFFRGEDSIGHSKVGDVSNSLRFVQLQPHAEATYTLPTIQLLGRYDLIDTRSKVDGETADHRRLENLLGTFSFRPDDLPGLRFFVQRIGVRDDLAPIDQTQTFLQGDVDFSLGKLLATATARRTDFEDITNGFSRRTDGVQGNLSYQDTFFHGRAIVAANALVSYDRQLETTRGALLAEKPVPIMHALSSIDATPEDSRDQPLIETPALVDGDFTRPTIIDIGPTGASFQNIAVDLGRFTEVDMFRVYVRDASGNLVPRGGSVDFTVWTSQDEIRWAPLSGAATTFVPALSAYETALPVTTSRFFKIVSFGLASTQALATEIKAFVHHRFGENVNRTTDILFSNANASFTYHLFPGMSLFYYGLFNDSRETSREQPKNSSSDSDQIGAVNWDVMPRLNLLAQYQWRKDTASGNFSQDYRALTTDLRYSAFRNVDVTFERISASQEDSAGRSDLTTAALRTYMRFLTTLDFSANVGVQRQKFLSGSQNGEITDQTYISGYSSADLTSDLHLRLDAFYAKNRQGQPSEPAVSDTSERYTADLFYRPGAQLGLGARVGWVRSGNQSGPAENYHVDWRPFPFGALLLNFQYDEDIEAFTSRRSRRLIFSPHWTINSHAAIDVNYTRQTITGSPKMNIFTATLTVIF